MNQYQQQSVFSALENKMNQNQQQNVFSALENKNDNDEIKLLSVLCVGERVL